MLYSVDYILNSSKHFETLKAYVGQGSAVLTLILMCNLNPIDENWREWTNNFEHKIKIISEMRFNVEKHLVENKVANDILFKAWPKNVSKKTKKAIISFGEETTFLWFLGIDNRLRLLSFSSINLQWNKNRKPLSIEDPTLLTIVVKNLSKRNKFEKIDTLDTESWLMDWPPNKKAQETLVNNHLWQKIIRDCFT